MKLSLSAILLSLILGPLPQAEKQPVIYVRHLEPPLHYPVLARLAQFQGTVVVKLRIAADGKVLAVKSLTRDEDPQSDGHPILRNETEKLVQKWTFGCAYCSSGEPYEKTLRFIYRLEAEEISFDDTRVVMELPDQVTITASRVECDHCPRKKIIPRGAE